MMGIAVITFANFGRDLVVLKAAMGIGQLK